MRVDVTELLGLPYVRGSNDPARGLDCWGAVVCAYREAGRRAPGLTRGLAGDACWPAVIDAGRGDDQQPEPWELVGKDLAAAKELLDVVRLSSIDPAGGVAVLVSTAPQRFFTAAPGVGTTLRTADQIRAHVLGVYRWRAL